MAFSVPINLSLGTYVTDGYRTGPQYPGVKNPYNGVTIQNGEVLANYPSASNTNTNPFAVLDFNKYGPGTLMSPVATFATYPFATAPGTIVTAAPVTVGVGTSWSYLTLVSPPSPPLPNGTVVNATTPNGVPYIQLDWPRTITVTVSVAAMVAPAKVTIFGTDFYGNKMQHTYEGVQAVGTYGLRLDRANKAFYTVTAVACTQNTGVGGLLSVQPSNTFGLPFVLKSSDDLIKWGWNSNDMLNQFGVSGALAGGTVTVTTPAVTTTSMILTSRQAMVGAEGHLSIGVITAATDTTLPSFTILSSGAETSTIGWSIVNGGQNLIVPADTTIPAVGNSFITGDPRGLFQLPESGSPWGASPNGTIENVFTYYVEGSDQTNNQLAAGLRPFSNTQGTTYPYLNFTNLYGLPQYYTGVPAT